MSSFVHRALIAATAAAVLAGSAGAQLLPGVGLPALPPVGLPTRDLPVAGPVLQTILAQPGASEAVAPTLNSVSGLPERLAEAPPATLLELRQLRLRELIRQYPRELENDGNGQPVRRGVLVVVDPDPASLQRVSQAGFGVVSDDRDAELGIRNVTLSVPRNLSTRQALKRLRSVAPGLQADFDHLYEPAGGALLPFAGALAASAGAGGGPRIGIVDGGVASHPSMAGASIEQNGFAGRPQPTGHGTAVASLIVGNQGPFQGAARGASLFVADVYGGSRAAGSASSIVRALSWLASKRPQVINISLVGPQNRLVQRAVQALRARGIGIVAAVGNDGPAAPPQYPASYPGVVAVTGVDARGRALPEAGKAAHLDFAAPGADMAAALPGQGYAKVRGTSFAAPLATARLALSGSFQRLASEARPGRGRVGRGIVCGTCRIDPRAVGAK
ncbi:S8 family serine peptidase [Sphingomonas sediminicola]|uniref:S8 family serine peptidase n=1 Tax=Sphingomonas sediminicola TaxID=386874 RepID=A0ABX6TCI9_9SPHN|nr:S8 family serine peptidase [Sphingomonas sediminicola]QNP45348.1 S8 family serine peptidase [Sphingomonas sediminicola]